MLEDVKTYLTIPNIFAGILHIAGFCFLYINREELLYDDEDNNPNTPTTLSLGRCWAWALFYIACSYWIRYSTGILPVTTPFPPGLEEMLLACLIYEFAKKGADISKIWLMRKGRGLFDPGYYNNQDSYPNQYPERPSSRYPARNNRSYPKTNNDKDCVSTPEQSSNYTPAKAYGDDEDSKS